uniref:Uncharacterized protein n=1 Tax=Meloidogyne enterolobii TaxID=390850 RepID=A0A6V7UJC9_MELEN|nr:unnamed protein product [Meloidogyne enterolobii]
MKEDKRQKRIKAKKAKKTNKIASTIIISESEKNIPQLEDSTSSRLVDCSDNLNNSGDENVIEAEEINNHALDIEDIIKEKDIPKIVEIEKKIHEDETNLKNIENEISENNLEINENSNEIEEGEIIDNEENEENNNRIVEEDDIKFLNELKRRIKMDKNNAWEHTYDITNPFNNPTIQIETNRQEHDKEDQEEMDEIILEELEGLFFIGGELDVLLDINFDEFYGKPFIYYNIEEKIEQILYSIEFIYEKIYGRRTELLLEEADKITLITKLMYITLKFKEFKEGFDKLHSTTIKLKKLIEPNRKWVMTSNNGTRLYEEYIAAIFCRREHSIPNLVLYAPCHTSTKLTLDEHISNIHLDHHTTKFINWINKMSLDGNFLGEDFSAFKDFEEIIRLCKLVEILNGKSRDLFTKKRNLDAFLINFVAFRVFLSRLVKYAESPITQCIGCYYDENNKSVTFSESSIIRLIAEKLKEIAVKYPNFRKECSRLIKLFETIFSGMQHVARLKSKMDEMDKYLKRF